MPLDNIIPKVSSIMNQVRDEGDSAVLNYTSQFDHVELTTAVFQVPQEIEIDADLKAAINVAKSNIERFHQSQPVDVRKVETMPGVTCWRKSVPINTAGLYIPGGNAPLFSTLLMLAVPARIAGCEQLVVCTPCNKNGAVDPTILYTARLMGIDTVFTVGGAQAIAAMTFGTQTIPRVDKIFGPGNQFVTAAKQLAQQYGTAIDMPAGPSEVLVIADESSHPDFIAADLLSQAEHGEDSQVVLVTTSEALVAEVQNAIAAQLKSLPRRNYAEAALKNSNVIVVGSDAEAMAFSNIYAPEHLIIATGNASEMADRVINAGSVFIGKYSCESAGDYASGTNHTLPTNGAARSYSGVSVDSFVKKITFQELTQEGLELIGPTVEVMAEAEGLLAHRRAVSIRLNSNRNV